MADERKVVPIIEGLIGRQHDIFDAMDAHPERKRRCPKCGDDDVKFGNHDKAYRGFTTSVHCNECKADETSNDAETLFLRWSEGPL